MKSSISALKLFKACRRAYELKHIEGLTPVVTAEALQTGRTYHQKIEDLYNGVLDTSDLSKESAMATAYRKYIYPNFPVKAVEEWVECKLEHGHSLIGRVDGRTEDNIIVEHKTASGDIGDEYEFNLQWDEQILAYMLITGSRKIYYTICKKPTIRQKKGESEEEFFDRMCAWYDEDTESKIRFFPIIRTDDEVKEFEKDLVALMDEVEAAGGRTLYRNPLYCNCWGRRCEYSSICLNYDKNQEYVEFERREKN